MLRIGFAVCVLAVINAGYSDVHATDSVITTVRGETCRSVSKDAAHAAEESEWSCAGPAGLSLLYYDINTRAGLFIGYRGKKLGDESMSWAPSGAGIGSRAEWRIQNGLPIGLIVGRWRNVDDETGRLSSTVEELLVIKISATSACAVAVVGALAPNAMKLAREQADRSAAFRCKTDKPIISTNVKTDTVKGLPARFAKFEMLDHNGSSVQFKRSLAGSIEIRYEEPRSALKVEVGALLFMGSEQNGLVKGQAFVFKSGCTPAGYPVSGRRSDGVLVLEGAAPSRGRGCDLAGSSKASKHARLIFEHDPILTLAAELEATEGAPEQAKAPNATPTLIPLDTGYYVDIVSPCKEASNATLTLFNGTSFGSAHQECLKPEVLKQPDGSYQIKEKCRTTQVEDGEWEVQTTKVDVRSRTRVDQTTPFGKFSFRYCKQASLPEPWASNDLETFFATK